MKYLLIIFFLLPSLGTQAQWTQCNSLKGGGIITDIAEFKGKLYMSGDGRGIFSSADNGDTWTDTGVPAQGNFLNFVLHKDELLAVSYGKLFRTAEGNIWNEGQAPNAFINDAQSDGETLLLATHLGIFKSTDDGNTWVDTNGENTSMGMASVAVDGSTLWAAASAPNNGTLFKSSNGGDTWQKIEVGSGEISNIFLKNGFVFLNAILNGVYRSGDDGMSWQLIHPTQVESDLFASEDALFFFSYNRLLKSVNNGESWSEGQHTTESYHPVQSIYATSDYVFIGCWGGGILRTSAVGNLPWESKNTGLNFITPNVILAFDNSIFLATERSFVRSSDDEGETWDQKNDAHNFRYTRTPSLTASATEMYAGTGGGGIQRSSDKGNLWVNRNTGLTNLNITALAATSSAVIAGTDDGVFISKNKGESWVNKPTGATLGVTCIHTKDDMIFVGTWDGLFLSKDGAETWSRLGSGLSSQRIDEITTIDSTLFVATQHGLFKTIDFGVTWELINSNNILSLSSFGQHIFIGTINRELYLSSDKGASWSFVGQDLPDTNVTAIGFSENNIFLGLYKYGVWKRQIGELISPQCTFTAIKSDSLFKPDQPILITSDQELRTASGGIIVAEDLLTSIEVKNGIGEPVNFTASITENSIIELTIDQPEIDQLYTVTIIDLQNAFGLPVQTTSQSFKAITNFIPEVFNSNVSVDQSGMQFNETFFVSSYDDNDDDALVKIKIVSIPDHGKLMLSGEEVNVNDEIDIEMISQLTYLPDVDFTGTDQWQWQGFDGTDYSSFEALVSISVTRITGINSAGPDAQFILFPNPVSEKLTIKLNFAPKSRGTLLITDLAGREMAKKNLSGQSPQEILDISPLPAGTYLVKLLLAEQEFHSLIIKK